jgi:hypothetical protein
MTSFFCVVSITFHTSVPAHTKCMDTSRKRFFCLKAQLNVYRLLHLFVGPNVVNELPSPLVHLHLHTNLSFFDGFHPFTT